MSIPHWQYFLSIESDLAKCSRYVEFDSRNFGVFSVEFARIIVAASAEFDAVAKKLCKHINPRLNPQSIDKYQPIILGQYPRIEECLVEIPSYRLQFQPWKDWAAQSPRWWTKSYNKIKHERETYFHEATLENAILATAGLLIGLIYYYDASHGGFPAVDYSLAPKLLEPLEPPGAMLGGRFEWTSTAWK